MFGTNYNLGLAGTTANLSDLERKIEYLVYAFVAVLVVGFFILKAIAVCKMAKKKGYKNWWLGMIPYANFILLGKLAGPIRIFKMDIPNMGIFLLIASLLLDIVNLLYYFGSYLATIVPGIEYVINLVYTFGYFIELVYFVASFSVAYAIFGKYEPQRRMLYSALSIIEPIFAILLIVIMNKKPYDSIDDYYRELMAKRYGQAYNPHTNPYQTYENPFSDYSDGNNSNTSNDDPFEEYKD